MRNTKNLLLLMAMLFTGNSYGYPLDGYEETGIRRVEEARLVTAGEMKGTKKIPGARLSTAEVDLRLLNHKDMQIPEPDPEFTAQIKDLLGEDAEAYSISVMDLTDPDNPRYAEYRDTHTQNVGSVGKLLVGLAYFQALADTWPDDLNKRTQILKETTMTADGFAHSDHHTVRIFDVANRKLVRRTIHDGDQASVWEYLDWMLSVSSNSAAAMMMRDAMLLKHYGKEYPPSEQEIVRFFKETSSKELTALFQQTFWEPITRNSLDLKQLRQGSFFTRGGKNRVNGGGNSYGSSRSLMEYLLLMEQGKLIDEYSSRQLKRLLYMTERRIRYASAPALKDSAVYFKSGSLYSCQPEEGFKCGKYKGNKMNYMNSIAIVESPAGDYKLNYIVTLVSNVLRKNSAVAHQTLATRIQRLLERYHLSSE
ncbi:MAG: hypothetical protein KAI15_02185 [Gammaproteobacteria bacterium]|nr:hypothetical protein [Gammaproteobacteria bacterium]